MITQDDIDSFLNQNNYDIRKTHNSRWLDQKVTYDVSAMIADCVLDYVHNNGNIEFSASNIWHSDYAANNILAIFNKPELDKKKMKNEYDKFFSQPLLFLASAKVLIFHKKGNRNFYTVGNYNLLDFIASRDKNAFMFTSMYIEKVMKDSGLWPLFEKSFNEQSKDSYNTLKDSFGNFLRQYTPINKELEPNRIFTKVLNPLAVSRRKLGTKRGSISKSLISFSDLQYNQPNFRDIHSQKPKEISRQDWVAELSKSANNKKNTYQVGKTKSYLHKFNDTYRSSKSELDDQWGVGEATNMHHIFPVAEYPELSDSIENLIAITPTQHYTKAHPKNNTQRIDKSYQELLLLAKLESIKSNLTGKIGFPIYDFEQFVHVLSVGFDEIINVKNNDYDEIKSIIIKHYNK